MTEQEVRDIAAAAVEYVEARQESAGWKAKRAELLSAGPCTGEGETDCYLTGWPLVAWCPRCRDSQSAHQRYRAAASRRTGALAKLKKLVSQRQDTQSASA